MKFFRLASMPKDLADLLITDPENPSIDPDTIWRAAKYSQDYTDATTFILTHMREGGWEVEKAFGTTNHGTLPASRFLWQDPELRDAPFDQAILGRLMVAGDNIVVAFWMGRGGPVLGNREIVNTAIPLMKKLGLIPPGLKLWVAGIDGKLLIQPHQTAWWNIDKPHNHYQIQGRDYTYPELAQALHTLPKASPEFTAIADFIRSSQEPELQNLKARLPRVPAQNRAPEWRERLKPENLESLGTQSRIDRYWDARTSSRRFRLACKLKVKV